MDVLTISHDKNGEALPVFSFEEEAEMFLQLEAPGTCWRARETLPGELVSLLYGPCAGVKSVALDPMPVMDGKIVADLTGRGRASFVRSLVDGPGRKPVPEMPESTDFSELLGEDGGARDAKKERVEAAWCGILKSTGESADGEGGTPVPDYTVLDFDPPDEPNRLSEAQRNWEPDRT